MSPLIIRLTLLATCLSAGCQRSASPPVSLPKSGGISFQDAARAWKLDQRYENGSAADRFSIVETLGGGVAVLDFDQDGHADLLFAGGGEFSGDRNLTPKPVGLWRNRGQQEMAAVSRDQHHITSRYYSHGIAAADANNDGFADLLVTGYGGVQFHRNLGDGTWEDETSSSGLKQESWSSSSGWGDINGDGHLDAYIVGYVDWSFDKDPPCFNQQQQREVCSPLVFEGVRDGLWMADGTGAFAEQGAEFGVDAGGKGIGVLIADLDLDGDVDIYVTNDTTPRRMYENRGGRLIEIGAISGTDLGQGGEAEGSMGTDLGDFDLDGLPDLWVANFEQETSAVYRNRGHLLFEHVSGETGVSSLSRENVGWAVIFADFDLDGDEDVFVSNGHVERHPLTATVRQKPILMANQNGKRFENLAQRAGAYFQQSQPGRGAATGDIDSDGDLDLVVSHIGEPASLLLNEASAEGRSLSVRLVGTVSNRSAIGAVVRLTCGDISQIRQCKGGGSYASTSDSRLTFGLPESVAGMERQIEIVWPSGRREKHSVSAATARLTTVENQKLVFDEPLSRPRDR